ncbi:MAG TPA: LptF/LptG family permease [Opitutaceae bacterium]|nr:LptF/LptG family permease [Opitutaceae bacterium]
MLKSVIFTCCAAVGMFAFVLMLGNAIKDLLGLVLAGQLELLTSLRLIALLVPFVITYALPMGMLTGVLLTLGRLSADSEITAMRAAGLSLLRIARPVVVLGALGLLLALYVNFDSMPRARVQYHKELADAVRANPISFIVPKTFIRDFPSAVVYVGEKEGAILREIWLWRLDHERRVTEVLRADSGRIDYDEATNELIFIGIQAKAERRDAKKPEDFSTAQPVGVFGSTEPVHLSLDRLFGRPKTKQRIDWMTYGQLKAERIRLDAENVPAAAAKEHALARLRVRMTMQEKFTTALSVLSFALIGVPLGIKVSRRETSANLGIALLLVLGYYFLTVMVKWLDRHPEYRPDVLLWLPNLFFIGLAVWLFRRAERS